MRFATIQTSDGPRAALLQGDAFIDLHAADAALPTSVRQLLEGGPVMLQAAKEAAARPGAMRIPAACGKLLPPITDPQKIICMGLNYSDHAAETGAKIPGEPVLFSKFATALIGPEQPILLPAVSKKVDYEAELVLVVGKKGRHLTAATALEHLAGYTIGNDVSARDWQLEKDGKQWMAGKTFDTFAPLGPMLATPDEIPDAHNLAIRLRLNGETMQESNTRNMIFTAGVALSLHLAGGDAVAGRPGVHGNAVRRRHGAQAAGLAQSRRCGGSGNRGSGRTAQSGDSRVILSYITFGIAGAMGRTVGGVGLRKSQSLRGRVSRSFSGAASVPPAEATRPRIRATPPP